MQPCQALRSFGGMRTRKAVSGSPVLVTPDGRYLIVRGRLWRCTDPHIPDDRRALLTASLMAARRDKGKAMREGDKAMREDARQRVDAAKIALGERGPVWWRDGAPDLTRRMVKNTSYAEWFAALPPPAAESAAERHYGVSPQAPPQPEEASTAGTRAGRLKSTAE